MLNCAWLKFGPVFSYRCDYPSLINSYARIAKKNLSFFYLARVASSRATLVSLRFIANKELKA